MKKNYFAPDASLVRMTSADVITLSICQALGVNNWTGEDVSAAEWKPID